MRVGILTIHRKCVRVRISLTIGKSRCATYATLPINVVAGEEGGADKSAPYDTLPTRLYAGFPRWRERPAIYRSAFHTSGYVDMLCARYCGLNPNSTTCPFPSFTSTIAALPFMCCAPSSQPDNSGSP